MPFHIPGSRNLLLFSMLASGLLQTSPHAMILMVYTKSYNPVPEEVKLTTASLMWDLKASKSTRTADSILKNKGFRYSVIEGSSITQEYSVGTGVSAYFLCDGSFRMDGFGVDDGGQAVFSVDGTEMLSKKSAEDNHMNDAVMFKTALIKLRLTDRGLHLHYTLSKPAPVHVGIFSAGGKTLGEWDWTESTSGAYEKDLDLNGLSSYGTLFARWNSVDEHSFQKIITGKSK